MLRELRKISTNYRKEGFADLKHELTIKHFNSFVQTVDSGIRRTKDY
jgi:hypothetical protein